VWYRAYLIRRIGGVTGDCLGFAAYVGFIVTTLVLAREG
jgi:adenosylcobinamide-GDP ribazoletransferase